MRRDQLEHAIRTACQIAGLTEVIIVGSQAILGTYTEDQLPFYATRSVEIDVLPIADDTGEIARLADEIEGAAGEFSPFEQLHGFSIDAVDLQLPRPPSGQDQMVLVSTISDGVKANHRAVASISAISTDFTRGQPVSGASPEFLGTGGLPPLPHQRRSAAPRKHVVNTDAPMRQATRCPASYFACTGNPAIFDPAVFLPG